MDYISKHLLKNPKTQELRQAVRGGLLPAYATGLCESYKLFLTRLLCQDRRVMLVLPDRGEAERLYDLFSVLMPSADLLTVPAREYVFYNFENISHTQEHARIGALDRLSRGDYRLALVPADSLLSLTPAPTALKRRSKTVTRGGTAELDAILRFLSEGGYTHSELTEHPGQFSHRGGIVEFFAPGAPYPVRFELFGDEIDSLSYYDPKTQRRVEDTDTARILPVAEATLTPEVKKEIEKRMRAKLAKLEQGDDDDAILNARHDLETLQAGTFKGIDRFLPLIHPAGPTLLDYDPQALCICYDLPKLRDAMEGFVFRTSQDLASLAERGATVMGRACYNEPTVAIGKMEQQGLVLLEDFLRQENSVTFQLVQGYHVTSLNAPSSESALCEDAAFYLQSGDLAIFAGSAARATYLPTLFNEHNIACALLREDAEIPKGAAAILGAGFPGGFYDRDAKFALIGSARISGKKKKRHSRYKPGSAINDFSDIKIGDYVVHENYGIGVYDGVHQVTTQGITREFIRIRYAGTDTLFIPCGQFDLISKYVGASDEVKVKLNKLGTGEWAKAKSRVKANVKDLAKGLIALYSARQNTPGHAFSPDNDWQRQFESSFEFEETEDQALCTAEIKADMEKPSPMDRLLCGDVGFGKTEVALRAAFKCVLDSKQVAMLTPTTLLAWQHYNTMLRRFEGFPVSIELLSRFRTPQQQEAILRRLRRGEIDILVGTHRILQKDVKFKDLGLLVVDEEQRFGVTHKENLKEMAKNVDVLTLSATPIPRTLNMALSGIRDMSVIETPPNDRHPISTYVCEYDTSLIMDALRRELSRGGQCYYLHNRVETIYKTANLINEAIPDAVVEVAHGQMAKEELGEIWDRMTEGKIDILVCTTIIETGVDVPNANTLIIENADCLGLAQLHQIRGRVGRSYKHAYAYFTYRQGRTLTEDGRKRLDAIREYTEFGSGFKIAMRDLQIRGAGNLLGAQQHGHMDSVGYDMYMQLLNQAINEEKGIETKAHLSECLIDLKVSAFIPEDYIDSSLARVDIYKKIAAIENDSDVSDIVDELIERFGDPPREVLALMDVSLVRAQCTQCGVTELTEKNKMLIIKFAKFDMKKIANVISAMKGNMFFSAGTDPYLSCRVQGNALDTAIEVCQKLTEVYTNAECE